MFDFAGGVNYRPSYGLIIVAGEREKKKNRMGAGTMTREHYNCSAVIMARTYTAISVI